MIMILIMRLIIHRGVKLLGKEVHRVVLLSLLPIPPLGDSNSSISSKMGYCQELHLTNCNEKIIIMGHHLLVVVIRIIL